MVPNDRSNIASGAIDVHGNFSHVRMPPGAEGNAPDFASCFLDLSQSQPALGCFHMQQSIGTKRMVIYS